jgi:myo-inositol-1(or 4)-monophosphatase
MEYVELMRPIIQKAGDLVMLHFRHNLTIQWKKDLSIQTNVDLLSEELLKRELCEALPSSGFIAEESVSQDIEPYVWVIDPIDGTKNFARGLPYFCINVALTRGDDVIAAVTYQPVLGEWFYAQKGHGAWRNGVRLSLNQQGWKTAGALVVASDYQVRHASLLRRVKDELKSLEHGVRFRVCGAAALDLAYTAAGSFDAVIFENLGWWDAAAGVLLVTEAGGTVSQYDGLPVTQSFKSLIAGDAEICQLMMPALRDFSAQK